MTVLNSFVLLSAFCMLQTHAFWWPATTTETPSTKTTTVLKQIPLTYFRTYTYQPLAGNPFAFPFSFGFGAAQTPLLSSARYDPYASSYPTPLDVPVSNMGPMMPPNQSTPPPTTQTPRTTPSSSSTSSTTTSTTTPAPTTTTTTTTSTTTTTTPPPPPPTPPTSTTTTTRQTPPPATLELTPPEYPTYNRRIYTSNAAYGNNYYTRPQYPYPYPDYYNYQQHAQTPPASSLSSSSLRQPIQATAQMPKSGTRIQFVPCMCPVSVSLTAGGVGGGGMSMQNAGMPVLRLSEGTMQARNVNDDNDTLDGLENDDDSGDNGDDDVDDNVGLENDDAIDNMDDVDEVDDVNDVRVANERDFIVSLAADASKAATAVSYPVPSTLSNAGAAAATTTTYKTSTLPNAATSSLSKIIIEALPTSSIESGERTVAQVSPQEILVLTAEGDRHESLI